MINPTTEHPIPAHCSPMARIARPFRGIGWTDLPTALRGNGAAGLVAEQQPTVGLAV